MTNAKLTRSTNEWGLSINRESPIALYQQIADALRAEINSGRRRPFERLPTEHDLVEKLGVSRVTVRQAVRVLVESGLIFARQGKGLFIAGPPIEHELGTLRGFYDSLVMQGYHPRTSVLKFSREDTPPLISQLKQFDGAYYRFQRLYQIEELAIVLADVVLPSFGMELIREDVERYPVYSILQKIIKRDVVRASAQMSATRVPAEVATLLNVTSQETVLHMERTSFDQNGICLESTHFYILPEMFAFQMEVAGPLAISSAIRRVNPS